MITPAISVRDLNFSWSNNQQLDNQLNEKLILSSCGFDVPRGEFWMLLGANGSGKSTLLKLLAGLMPLQSGKLEIQRPVGFVFQNPDHQLVMPTVGADVAFGLVAEKLSHTEAKQRVADALRAVNLLDLERRPIYALSGGQKQRIAIAGAIAQNCPVLILDEPTALLDPDTQIELVSQVQNLVKTRGITALWVTHRLEELDYCDGAFLLEQGRIVDRGNPQRLKEKMMSFAV
jgi:energy-coupling factor transport system ATP-binding protein